MSNFESINHYASLPARSRSAATDNIAALLMIAAEFATVLSASILTGIAYHLVIYDQMGQLQNYVRFGAIVFFFYAAYQILHKQHDIQEVLHAQDNYRYTFFAWTIGYLCAFAATFITKDIEVLSRGAVVLFYFAGGAAILTLRLGFVRLFNAAFENDWLIRRRVFLLGTGDRVREFHNTYANQLLACEVIGSITVPESSHSNEDGKGQELRQQAIVREAVERARDQLADDVIVLLPWTEQDLIDLCTERFMNVPAALHLGPEKLLNRFNGVQFSRIGLFNSLQLVRKPMKPLGLLAKRVFDILVASIALVLLSPLLVLVAWLVKLDSKGPALFLQRRYGFNQREFRIIKFRTMTTLDDGDVVKQATKNDSRITRLGAFLRKYNIDELPQLINVLTGDMSIVGPRPHAVSHNVSYENRIGLYARRHNVKPGITGWAQINGWRGETDTDDKMRARVEHDLFYIDNWSVWLDTYIIIMTVLSRSAYRNAR